MKRYVPLLDTVSNYDRSWMTADIAAALTVWAIVVPEAMAYASIAGMPPATGLYAASLPLLAYALLGSSRRMTFGPTAATSALSAATVAPFAVANPDAFIPLTVALAVVVGTVLLLAGIARLGVIAEFLSGPVLIGFIVGVALTIVLGQMDKILEIEVEGEGFLAELISVIRGLPDTNPASLLMAAATFAALLGLHRLSPRLPAALVVVIAAIAAVEVFDLADSMHVVGEITGGLPSLGLPDIGMEGWASLIPGAVGVAVVVYGETMALAKSFAKQHRETVDPNQELLAAGTANIAGGLFGSFATAGSNSRTAAADASGVQSQVSSVVVAVLVLVTAAFLTPLFESLPEAVLGAIVVHAVARLIKIRPLSTLWNQNRADFAAAAATLMGVLFFDVLAGLLIGVFVSLGLLMARAANPHVAVLALDPEAGIYRDIDRFDEGETPVLADGITILRFDSELFFANASALTRAVSDAVEQNRPYAVVFDAEAVTAIDTTAAEAIRGIIEDLERQGVTFAISRLTAKPREDLARCGVDVTGITYRRTVEAVAAVGSAHEGDIADG